MSWNNIRYNIINIVVLILTAALFIYDYRNIKEIFCGENLFSIFILFLTVLVVHATKLGRLYLALSGFNIDFISSVKIY